MAQAAYVSPKLFRLMCEIAIMPPTEKSKWAVSANVPWVLIQELRQELDKRGFDWRACRREMLKARRQAEVTP